MKNYFLTATEKIKSKLNPENFNMKHCLEDLSSNSGSFPLSFKNPRPNFTITSFTSLLNSFKDQFKFFFLIKRQIIFKMLTTILAILACPLIDAIRTQGSFRPKQDRKIFDSVTKRFIWKCVRQ